ncbi:hypothetical protein Plhal304r1_c062g0149001 [Plasmopara halstedii]
MAHLDDKRERIGAFTDKPLSYPPRVRTLCPFSISGDVANTVVELRRCSTQNQRDGPNSECRASLTIGATVMPIHAYIIT